MTAAMKRREFITLLCGAASLVADRATEAWYHPSIA
jgi:hypothetical protein